ncbi:YciI family protein [Neobacillus sp. LXY-1]|uniref:YciI family protein n=1 Tax=Neobacillus sp. LXY-1 TaxID=3379133 RepID=UPI003EE1081E
MNLYLITTSRTENFNNDFIKPHYDFLDKLKHNNQLEAYGPFSDGSGGAYLIKCNSLDEATKIGNSDPLIKSGSSTVVVKEWILKD